jgi:hypothetical protein
MTFIQLMKLAVFENVGGLIISLAVIIDVMPNGNCTPTLQKPEGFRAKASRVKL